jgi:hypothetical protein
VCACVRVRVFVRERKAEYVHVCMVSLARARALAHPCSRALSRLGAGTTVALTANRTNIGGMNAPKWPHRRSKRASVSFTQPESPLGKGGGAVSRRSICVGRGAPSNVGRC